MEESETQAAMSRKEKRKAIKKMKRKQTRKEIALKQKRQEEEDPQQLILIEQEEAKRSDAVRLIFEERERAWLEAMEIRKQKQQEERRIKALEEEEQLSLNHQIENANEDGDDDDWEYVEEGPAEIIYKGNEITIKKKRVKVPKKNKQLQTIKEDCDRPTSNPLLPQSEAFDDYKHSSLSAQQLIETVAEQVPHFGTEQDKDHCPFHLKTGACRFGQHCSRVHFYPYKSSTLLIKNMYNGPGLTWEQDEGLEYTDEEIERCYEDFYEDVHTEFLKFGEIINFKVCINGASHLRGNVYVQYSALESALVAHQSINGRYFAGKQISCDFINVTRWKVAICGEYVKSRYKTCSRGTACNFIHCFHNPGGDYEWADSDRPPPKYWVEKMVALFGYSDAYQKQMMEDNTRQLRNSRMSMTDSWRYVAQRSSSRDRSYSSSTGSGRRYDNEYYAPKGTGYQRLSDEDNAYLEDCNDRKNRKYGDTDGDTDRDVYHGHKRKSSRRGNRDQKNKTYETESDGHLLERGRNRLTEHCSTRKSSSQHGKGGLHHDCGDCEKIVHEVSGDRSTRDKDRESYHDSRRSSGHKRKEGYDHKDHKSKAQDSNGEWSDSIKKDDEHHSIRKSLVHIGNASEGSKEQDSSGRVCTAELSEDFLDKGAEKHCGHANKRSKHCNNVAAQDVKHTRGHLGLKTKEADSPVKISKSYGTPEPCILDQDNIGVQIDKQDRWEPERNSEGRAGSLESHESSDFVSKLYCDDKVGKLEHRYDAGEVTCSKHQKSRRLQRAMVNVTMEKDQEVAANQAIGDAQIALTM